MWSAARGDSEPERGGGSPERGQSVASPAPGQLSSAGRRPGSHPPPSVRLPAPAARRGSRLCALRPGWVQVGEAEHGDPGRSTCSTWLQVSVSDGSPPQISSLTVRSVSSRQARRQTNPTFPHGLFCDWSGVTHSGLRLSM